MKAIHVIQLHEGHPQFFKEIPPGDDLMLAENRVRSVEKQKGGIQYA